VAVSVGTSGWQYLHWRDAFYPAGLAAAHWLAFYAERFSTVEVNASFYRLPKRETVERWAATVPDGFVLTFKASRYVTHVRRLRDCAEPLERMRGIFEGAGTNLGPILFQLPPTLRADEPLLRAFLGSLPSAFRAAIEFRHPSWFTDGVLEALDASGAALVHADRPGVRVSIPTLGGWAYLRVPSGPLGWTRLSTLEARCVRGRDRRNAAALGVRVLQQRHGRCGPSGCRHVRRTPRRSTRRRDRVGPSPRKRFRILRGGFGSEGVRRPCAAPVG
jgi:uncharacterized protein YecE (DUF72 family)